MSKQASLNGRKRNMRAAIYVRTSSERQADADKVSPQAQENDCRALCERQGYAVVDVYSDTEKYRVGRRMVEPSGTRADRPQLRRILADARAGRFDVIIAWREDRLYRGYRPMLDVLDCLDDAGIDIELAKEHFDRKIAPVKAWAARMELDAKHDRFMMGAAGRLARGKPWLPTLPYGYAKDDGEIVVDESEAEWVRKMWQWRAEGVAGREIRQRLIAGGAPQRRGGKHRWPVSHLYRTLRTECYHTGKIRIVWDGQEYLCDMPVLVDADTAARVQARADDWKKYPAGNLKAPALAGGLVYCLVCGWKMTMIGRKNNGRLYQYYRCLAAGALGERPAGCCGEVAMARVDAETWERLWRLFADRDEFERRLQDHIRTAQAQEKDGAAEADTLKEQLADLHLQRQMVLTAWRRREIKTADRDFQLAAIGAEQEELESALAKASLSAGGRAEKLVQAAEIFRAHALTGFERINAVPDTPEKAQLQFEARRKLVAAFVTRVTIKPDKAVEVTTAFEIDTEEPIAADGYPTGDNIKVHRTYSELA